MKSISHKLATAVLTAFAFAGVALAADAQRQAEVARLGADVMPFSLKDTTHIFTKTKDGGTQRVIANKPSDVQQVALIREHLRNIRQQFLTGDFPGPTHIHGADMPGLQALKAAAPGQIKIQYNDVNAGAELTFRSADKKLVSALHDWFDAQLSDHGSDARAGHMHHDNDGMTTQ